jgi:hypothetical protein
MRNRIFRIGNRVSTPSGTGVVTLIDRSVSRLYKVRLDKDTSKFEWFFWSDLEPISEEEEIASLSKDIEKRVEISTKQIADLVVMFVDPHPSLGYNMTIQELLSKLVESDDDFVSLKV